LIFVTKNPFSITQMVLSYQDNFGDMLDSGEKNTGFPP
jgi:hypothetical protein